MFGGSVRGRCWFSPFGVVNFRDTTLDFSHTQSVGQKSDIPQVPCAATSAIHPMQVGGSRLNHRIPASATSLSPSIIDDHQLDESHH